MSLHDWCFSGPMCKGVRKRSVAGFCCPWNPWAWRWGGLATSAHRRSSQTPFCKSFTLHKTAFPSFIIYSGRAKYSARTKYSDDMWICEILNQCIKIKSSGKKVFGPQYQFVLSNRRIPSFFFKFIFSKLFIAIFTLKMYRFFYMPIQMDFKQNFFNCLLLLRF